MTGGVTTCLACAIGTGEADASAKGGTSADGTASGSEPDGDGAGEADAGRLKGAMALKNTGRGALRAATPSPVSAGVASGTPKRRAATSISGDVRCPPSCL